MNQHQLERILKSIARLSAPLLAAACGGSTMTDPGGGAGAPEAAGATTGGMDAGGSETAGSSTGGRHSNGGATSSGGAAGSVSGGTSGGTSAGAGGLSSAGTAGVGAAGGGDAGGGGGLGGAPSCHASVLVSCIPVAVTVPSECVPLNTAPGTALPLTTCGTICGASPFLSCTLMGTSGASASVNCTGGCAVGRRPYGFCPSAVEACKLGRYFAQLSELEAASVQAFRILRDDLRAHGAPKRLVKAAERAARDEIRHARTTRALARRSGGAPGTVTRVRVPRRSLEAIARENAVEGCVRETFGALLATWQAAAATDPLVRAAMSRISRDETRHAALSWQVRRWLETRLDIAARTRVDQAQADAALELQQAVRTEATPSFAARIGLPATPLAHHLAAELAGALWS